MKPTTKSLRSVVMAIRAERNARDNQCWSEGANSIHAYRVAIAVIDGITHDILTIDDEMGLICAGDVFKS